MSLGPYRLGLAAITLGALLLQAALFLAGVERLSADESARALLAHGLTWANALEPFIWPPFTKLFIGLALQVHDDSFLVPRLLSNIAGLLVLLVLVALAAALFRDRRVQLAAAALAAVQPYRLLFGVAPMSDIYFMLFVLLAAVCVLRWLRQEGGTAALLAGCASLLLAETVRFEAVIFGLCLGLLVLWRWWRGEVGTKLLLAAGLLLGGFPAFWVANSLAWYGSLDNLREASEQFRDALGADYAFALQWMPIARPLLLEVVWNPAVLLGLAALAAALRRDATLRAFALAFFLPLPLISALMVATLSIPLAVTWRSFGVWSLLLVPWTAYGLVRLADRLRRLSPVLVPPVLVAVALLPPAVHAGRLAWRDGIMNLETSQPRRERQAGLALRAVLEREGGRALVDSWDNLDFLDLIAGSGAPQLFVTSAGAPPAAVAGALHLRRAAPRPEDAAQRDLYLSDRFGLREGGDRLALGEWDIRLLVIREPDFRRALDASPLVERVPADWPGWVVYRLRPVPPPGG